MSKAGVVVTTKLPFIDKETIEMTSSWTFFLLKASLSILHIFIDKKEEATAFCDCKRVHLLERANLPFLLVVVHLLLVLSLGLRAVLLPLVLFPLLVLLTVCYSCVFVVETPFLATAD